MTGIPGPLRDDGLFSLTALHSILPACADIEQAIAHIRALPLNAYGFSLIMGDADGGLALIEKTSAGLVVLDPEQYAIAHTNHILDEDFAAQNPTQSEPTDSNGRRRLENARALLAAGVPAREARHDSAEEFCRLKARRCTAMAWIFIPAYCFAIP